MGFGRKGRNPTGNELPIVSEGTRLIPSHINQIVAAVDRATLKGGKGYRFSQNSGGTSIQVNPKNDPIPWSAFTFGVTLCINAGNVWGKGIGQMPLHTTSEWGGVTPDPSKKFWTARPVMVGISGGNIVATDEINSAVSGTATNIIQVPYQTGYYYIEYGDWDGRTDLAATGSADTLKGTKQFILKHATTLSASDEVVVICYLDEEKRVYQSVKGDIWWGLVGDDGHPFKITIRRVNEEYRAFLAYGSVNNEDVYYETGGWVGDDDADGLFVGSSPVTKQVVLVMSYEDGSPFPTNPEVAIYDESEDITNTEGTAYVRIGYITVTQEGQGQTARPVFEIDQAVSGSLWVERFKCGDDDPVYWVTKI